MKCFRIALILLTLAAAAPDTAYAADEEAKGLYQAARQAEAGGDTLNAYFLYGRAAALAGDNQPLVDLIRAQSRLLQTRLTQSSSVTTGPDKTIDLDELDRETRMADRVVLDEVSPTDVIESRAALLPPRLKPSTERQSFDLRGTIRPVWEQVGKAFGINITFEQDFQAPGAITFKMENVTMSDAFRSLEAATNAFMVPVRGDLALVFRDSADKRTANMPTIAMAIPIPQRFNVQEAQELASGVQQIMELKHIAVDAGRHIIFIRDQEYKVQAARRIITDLVRLRAQVEVDVELISATKSSTLNYGFSLPTLFNLQNLAGAVNMARLGLSTSMIGIAISSASAMASLSKSDTDTALRAQITSLDGQQAQLHVGDRYPVVTSTFGDPTIPNSNTPVTQFQDLGLKLQITPTVHGDNEVTLAIESEYNLLGASSNNGIPIISGRKFSGTTRLKFGEVAIVAGLAVSSTSHTIAGVAGLGNIPYAGHLFRQDTKTDDESQVYILLKPRLLSDPAWEDPPQDFWIGTETKPPTIY